MIYIRHFNKHTLKEFINSEEYRLLEEIPITKHRALSQINNPRASDEDVLLLVAYEQEQMVGYLGVLPDLIFLNTRPVKCGWFSCIWVDQNHRGKNIAFQLVQKAMELWNNKILATEFTGPARRLYDKTNKFVDLQEKAGIRLYMRFNLHTILPPKKRLFQKSKILLKTIDLLANLILDIRFYLYRHNVPDLRFEYVNQINGATAGFLKNQQQQQLFRRGKEELNWVIKNPWILSSATNDIESGNYHFSSFDRRFEFVPLKIFNEENKLLAFLLFARRNDDLKLPYCYYICNTGWIAEVIKLHLIKWRISTFTTFHQSLASVLNETNMCSLLKREMKRSYIISSAFDIDPLEINFEIQDGDGDCSFT